MGNSSNRAVQSTESEKTPFLIVAGTYRAGTTALFRYLSDHPQVAPARIKEVGYFLPVASEMGSEYRVGRDPLATYLELFDDATAEPSVRVEATPGYLYEPETAKAIRTALPEARIALTLREQVDWLTSWYKTIKVLRQIEPALSFDDWVDRQLADRRPASERPYSMRAVEHGRFARYVERYVDIFGLARVSVIFFDELERCPRRVMQRLAAFGGLDPEYYGGYHFEIVNRAVKLRRAKQYDLYAATVGRAAAVANRFGFGETFHRRRAKLDDRVYRLVTTTADEVHVSADIRSRLREHYAGDNARLEAIVGRRTPWR
jgi:hypothetical protein